MPARFRLLLAAVIVALSAWGGATYAGRAAADTSVVTDRPIADLDLNALVGSGDPDKRVIETAYELTHPDGRTILVGVPRKGDNVNIYTLPLHFKKILKGSHGGSSVPDVEIPRLVRLVEQGKMKLDGLYTHEFPLEKINDAIACFRSGEAGRVLINLNNL